jgi:urease accessory protein
MEAAAMLNLRELATGEDAGAAAVAGVATLSFEQRRKSRLLVTLDDGREAALLLPRGTILHDGDLLRVDGDPTAMVAVRAAAEMLSVARAGDPHLIARAAYHLGNRHVPLEIEREWLAYEHDHVLDDMVRELGLTVETRVAPFEPEAGGYRHDTLPSQAHGAPRSNAHAHARDHSHDR